MIKLTKKTKIKIDIGPAKWKCELLVNSIPLLAYADGLLADDIDILDYFSLREKFLMSQIEPEKYTFAAFYTQDIANLQNIQNVDLNTITALNSKIKIVATIVERILLVLRAMQ